jgi:Flp pilus assembly protein TadD
VPAAKAVADTLESQLADFQQKTSSVRSEQTKLDPTQAEKLRALGYLASDNASANSGEKVAIAPKDKIEIANKFHRALVDLEEDRYEEAITELREVVRLEPDIASAIWNWAAPWFMSSDIKRRCRFCAPLREKTRIPAWLITSWGWR